MKTAASQLNAQRPGVSHGITAASQGSLAYAITVLARDGWCVIRAILYPLLRKPPWTTM
ncbi:hypothetical protein IF2G_06148 [Cordyceps javanica]|nr:hypothetical protein IF2G_06148 [Cordyceps javanica]